MDVLRTLPMLMFTCMIVYQVVLGIQQRCQMRLVNFSQVLGRCWGGDCGNACYKCLKHYRNQHVHGMLDRFSALQLLDWGQKVNLLVRLVLKNKKPIYPQLLTCLRCLVVTLYSNKIGSWQLTVY